MSKNILLVENDEKIAKAIIYQLQDILNYHVKHISTIDILQKNLIAVNDYYVAIVDFNLPLAVPSDIINLLKKYNLPIIVYCRSSYAQKKGNLFKNDVIDIVTYETKPNLQSLALSIKNFSLLKAATILVVDDSKVQRVLISQTLREYFITVYEACSGKEALKIIKENANIQVILIDYIMPEMNGLELIIKLRKIYTTHEKKLIGISGSTDKDISAKLLHNGADDFLGKPYSIEELLSRLLINIESLSSYNLVQSQLKILKQKNYEILESTVLLNEYKKALDSSNIVSKMDINGDITYINDRFSKVSGYEKDELLGEKHFLFKNTNSKLSIKNILPEDIYSDIIKNKTKSGKDYYVDVSVIPIKNVKGEISQYFAIHQDVTELINQKNVIEDQSKTLQNNLKELKVMQDDLVETRKIASLTKMLAGLSHSMNTPLGVLVTAVSVIKQIGSELKDMLTMKTLTQSKLNISIDNMENTSILIEKNTNELVSLTQAFKKLSFDIDETSKEVIDINDVIKELIENFEIATKNISTKISFQSLKKSIILNVSANTIVQIITELLDNALKFAFINKKDGEIIVKTSIKDSNALIIISDNGCGINEKVKEFLFEPFSSAMQAHGGSGLGLSLVFNLVKQKLKGTIILDEDYTKGTRFIITVPLMK